MKAKEMQLKAKEYAKKQRELISRKGTRKAGDTSETQENNSPNVGKSSVHKEIVSSHIGLVSIDSASSKSMNNVSAANTTEKLPPSTSVRESQRTVP